MSKAHDRVIKDEADAEEREGARQAAIDLELAMDAARAAAAIAAEEPTAPAAKRTFRDKFREFFGMDSL